MKLHLSFNTRMCTFVVYTLCLLSSANVANPRIGWSLSVTLCLSVCVCTVKGKQLELSTPNFKLLGTLIFYSSGSACIDLEVRRSRSHGHENGHSHMASNGCRGHCTTSASLGLCIVWLLMFLILCSHQSGYCLSLFPVIDM